MDWNQHGQPVGPDVPGWRGAGPLPIMAMKGRFVRLDLMEPSVDAPPLFDAFAPGGDPLWTYMPIGPFRAADELREALDMLVEQRDLQFWTIRLQGHLASRAAGRPLGFAAYLRD